MDALIEMNGLRVEMNWASRYDIAVKEREWVLQVIERMVTQVSSEMGDDLAARLDRINELEDLLAGKDRLVAESWRAQTDLQKANDDLTQEVANLEDDKAVLVGRVEALEGERDELAERLETNSTSATRHWKEAADEAARLRRENIDLVRKLEASGEELTSTQARLERCQATCVKLEARTEGDDQ